MKPEHPDSENHAFCPACGGEYELTRRGADWIYHCARCNKTLTSAQFRAELLQAGQEKRDGK